MDEKQESTRKHEGEDIPPPEGPIAIHSVPIEKSVSGRPSVFSSLHAFLEIFLCSGIPTSLLAVLTLGLLGVPDESILIHPFYIACMVGLESCLLLLLVIRLQQLRGLGIADLGWHWPDLRREAGIGLRLVPLLLLSNVLIGLLLEKFLPQWRSESNPMLDLIESPQDLFLFFFVALLAGAFKEEVQRAFILQRFRDELRIPILGLALWSLMFGYGHAVQGIDSALGATIFGILFGIFYLWRRSMIAPMVAHSVYNSLVLIGYWFLGLD